MNEKTIKGLVEAAYRSGKVDGGLEMLNREKIQENIRKRQEEYNRIWNAAIEAAAHICADTISRDRVMGLKR